MSADTKVNKDHSKPSLTLDYKELLLVPEFLELLKVLVTVDFISLITPDVSQVQINLKKDV